jgi:hypothetical protein
MRLVLGLALLALLVGLLVIDGGASTSFFAPNRIAVTAITGMLIFMGFSGLAILSPIGDRSYSLYLWHFPLLSLAALEFDSSVTSRVVAVLVSVVLAELSYRLIEVRSLAIDVDQFFKRARVALVVAVAAFGLITAIGVYGWPEKFADTVLQREVMPDPIAHWDTPTDQCAFVGDGGEYHCNIGDFPKAELTLVGDSHARGLALGFGMAADALQRSWSANTRPGCTFARFPVGVQGDGCDLWTEATVQRLVVERPELVVLFQCYRVGVGCPQPTMGAEQQGEYVAGVASIVGELNDAGIAVLNVLSLPAVSPEQSSPSLLWNSSRVPIQSGAWATNAAVAQQLQTIADASDGLFQIGDISKGLCKKRFCKYVSGSNEPLWFDTDHLSLSGVIDRAQPLQIEIERALDSL